MTKTIWRDVEGVVEQSLAETEVSGCPSSGYLNQSHILLIQEASK